MKTIKVYFADGNSLITGFNGTHEEAKSYYVGKTFNMGIIEDNLVTVTRIIFCE